MWDTFKNTYRRRNSVISNGISFIICYISDCLSISVTFYSRIPKAFFNSPCGIPNILVHNLLGFLLVLLFLKWQKYILKIQFCLIYLINPGPVHHWITNQVSKYRKHLLEFHLAQSDLEILLIHSYLPLCRIVHVAINIFYIYIYTSNQGLSQDLVTACRKLAIGKSVGIPFFKGDHNILRLLP